MKLKAVLFSMVLLVSGYVNAGIISTIGTSGSDFRCLGTAGGCGQTFGQTFTVTGLDTYLDDLGLVLSRVDNGPLNVQFKLYSWNGSNISGASLFQSSVLSVNNSISQLYTFDTNVNLVSGNQYMALFDTSGIGNTTAPASGFTSISNASYAGGSFFWERTSGNGVWNSSGGDTLFAANLTTASVPEPSTLAIFALGFMGLVARRFKK